MRRMLTLAVLLGLFGMVPAAHVMATSSTPILLGTLAGPGSASVTPGGGLLPAEICFGFDLDGDAELNIATGVCTPEFTAAGAYDVGPANSSDWNSLVNLLTDGHTGESSCVEINTADGGSGIGCGPESMDFAGSHLSFLRFNVTTALDNLIEYQSIELWGFPDADGDGVADSDDNCPTVENTTQVDTDGDGLGDACDTDDDNDGLSDDDEATTGTDPLVADSDGDGILDGSDPDSVDSAIVALPDASFEAVGHRSAFDAQLDHIQDLIEDGQTGKAVKKLQLLRTHVDGCDGSAGELADSDDWIVDCDDQRQIRGLIDLLITNLTA